jgi:hypothetical protein
MTTTELTQQTPDQHTIEVLDGLITERLKKKGTKGLWYDSS